MMRDASYKEKELNYSAICRGHPDADDDDILTTVSHIIAGSCTHMTTYL